MSSLDNFFSQYLSSVYIPQLTFSDIIEIIILAFVVYNVLVWIKDSRAWVLLKGIIVVLLCVLIAVILNLRTILWIAGKTVSVGIIALVIIFQPELRKALEQLGRKRLFRGFTIFDNNKDKDDKFTDRTVAELVRATFELAKTRTGALIVLEQDMHLTEYANTGIAMDALTTSQLLINIFEHNTPLHDGAVIIRGDRIVAATCYLPLSDNMKLSKELGTRHRAGVGISEVTDSFTIIVSEETGAVSVAVGGELIRNLDMESFRSKLEYLRNNSMDAKSLKLWKGRLKREGKNVK